LPAKARRAVRQDMNTCRWPRNTNVWRVITRSPCDPSVQAGLLSGLLSVLIPAMTPVPQVVAMLDKLMIKTKSKPEGLKYDKQQTTVFC
jgi:hypothetical protein